MIQKKEIKEGVLRHKLLPQLAAFFYYHVSWLLYVINPSMSYLLNADFEDHAEHEYMEFVRETPALAQEPFDSEFKADYGDTGNLADLFRRIGLDERHHKEEGLARAEQARFPGSAAFDEFHHRGGGTPG